MADEIIRPRLTDHLGLEFVQEDIDFAIPHLAEDIPLYLDPFLPWVSKSSEYRALHEQFI